MFGKNLAEFGPARTWRVRPAAAAGSRGRHSAGSPSHGRRGYGPALGDAAGEDAAGLGDAAVSDGFTPGAGKSAAAAARILTRSGTWTEPYGEMLAGWTIGNFTTSW